MPVHNFFCTRFWDLIPSLISIYYYIYIYIYLTTCTSATFSFPCLSHLGGLCLFQNCLGCRMNLTGKLWWQDLWINHLHYFFKKDESHMIHRTQLFLQKRRIPYDPQDTTIHIYVVCSLYMILYNIHLPIIYMYMTYMTCISNILPVYHLTNRLPSRSLWQHLQQIVWQGLIGHHLYTFLHCRGLYHFCRKPILEADYWEHLAGGWNISIKWPNDSVNNTHSNHILYQPAN